MNINNKSLGLISSVFAITLGSTNPAGACDWLCCGGDDEINSETTRLNIQSNQQPPVLTTSENSLVHQSIQSISSQANHLTLKVEERQRLLQERKEKLEDEKRNIEIEEQLLKELEKIKANTKKEEVKVTAEEADLQKKQEELEARKKALLQTPVKQKPSSRTESGIPPEKISEAPTSISTPMPQSASTNQVSKPVVEPNSVSAVVPTTFQTPDDSYSDTEESSEAQALSKHQQSVVDLEMKDQVSLQIWNHLAEDKPLSKALLSAIQDLDPSLLISKDAIIKIAFLSKSTFELGIGTTKLSKSYTY